MKRLCVLGSLHLDVIVNAKQLPRLDETVIGDKVNYLFEIFHMQYFVTIKLW